MTVLAWVDDMNRERLDSLSDYFRGQLDDVRARMAGPQTKSDHETLAERECRYVAMLEGMT